MHGRLWTAARRKRHGLQPEGTCVLCDQEGKTTDHLLLGCVFARQVWNSLLRTANMQEINPLPDSRLADWWMLSRMMVAADIRRAFDSMLIIVT